MLKRGSTWIAGTCLIILTAGSFAAHHEGPSETIEDDAKPLSEPEEDASSAKTKIASDQPAGSASENPCMEDIRNHCSDSFGTGDRGAVMQCVQDNYTNFSKQCQAAIQARLQGQ